MKRFVAVVLSFFTCAVLAAEPLIVYSGRSEALVAPLFKQFEQDTGIKLDVRYNSTSSLATQFLNEQQNSPADVLFFQESGYLSLLAQAGLLKTLSPQIRNTVAPGFQDEQGQWIGSSARVRVLAYNTDKVKPEDLPKDLKELTQSKWQEKMGWAPTNASMQSHVSALRALWGEEETFKWLENVQANKPLAFQKNAQIVNAVGNGELEVGWTNHYYLYQLKKLDPKLPVANYHFPASGSAGNILIISGAAISKHTQKTEQAEKFINYLLSEKTQNYFANETFEYPTRMGVKTHPDVTPLSEITFAKVTQQQLADLQPTVAMLRRLGLL